MAMRVHAVLGLLLGLALGVPVAPRRPRAEAAPPLPEPPGHGHGEAGVECVCLEWRSPDARRVDPEALILAFEVDMGLRLMARTRTDTVYGAVSVSGGERVWVCLYTAPRGPAGGRAAALAECPMAARARAQAAIDAACARLAR